MCKPKSLQRRLTSGVFTFLLVMMEILVISLVYEAGEQQGLQDLRRIGFWALWLVPFHVVFYGPIWLTPIILRHLEMRKNGTCLPKPTDAEMDGKAVDAQSKTQTDATSSLTETCATVFGLLMFGGATAFCGYFVVASFRIRFTNVIIRATLVLSIGMMGVVCASITGAMLVSLCRELLRSLSKEK